MTLKYNGEELPTDLRGRALPARWNNKDKEWNVLTVEETSYESNYSYCDSMDIGIDAKPISNVYKEIREILLQADPDNDHDLLIGNASKQVMILKAGRQMTIPIDNLDKLFVRAKGQGNNKLNFFARANLLLDRNSIELKRFDLGVSFGLYIKDDGSIGGWSNGSEMMHITRQEAVDTGLITEEAANTMPDYHFVPEGNDFIHVTAKNMCAAALREDGTIECWGLNDNHNKISDKPTGNDFIKIEAGNDFFVGLKEDGTIVSWGADTGGVVTETPSDDIFIDIKISWEHVVAQKNDGSIVGWGQGGHGSTIKNLPLRPDIKNFCISHLGFGHFITKEGYIINWLSNYGGSENLDLIPRDSNWKKVFTSIMNGPSLAIDNSDKLKIWGSVGFDDPYEPMYIHSNYDFKSIINNVSGISIAVTKDDKLIPITGDLENDDILIEIPEDLYIEPTELYNGGGGGISLT